MLQIVTFNTGGARKLRQPPHNPVQVGQDTAETLRAAVYPQHPTFVALQETGWLRREDGTHHSLHDALSVALGADYTARFAPELDSQTHPHNRLWGRDAYAGMQHAAEGNGFVTNMPFAAWDWATFAGTTDAWTFAQVSRAALYSTGTRDTQPRNLIVASVMHPEYGALYVLNTHFGILTGENRHDPAHPRTQEGEEQRQHQAAEIVRVTTELRVAEMMHNAQPRPIILAGDFNAAPDAPSMQALAEVFTPLPVSNPAPEQWTHADHKILIDHIFISDPRKILPAGHCFIQADAPFDNLSDHRAVVAVFEG